MRLPPLSAARCRITASISHKFFAAAGAVPPPYFKERRDDHARKKAERASLGSRFLADRLAACRVGTARGIPARRAAAPLSRILARAAHFAGGQRLPVFIKDSTYHCFLFNIVNSLPYRLAIHTLSMEHERQCSARQPQQDIR